MSLARIGDLVLAYPADTDGRASREPPIRGILCAYLPSGNVILRTWARTYFCHPNVKILQYRLDKEVEQ